MDGAETRAAGDSSRPWELQWTGATSCPNLFDRIGRTDPAVSLSAPTLMALTLLSAIAVHSIATASVLTAPSAQVEPHGAMLRNPDISATHVVFSYADDLWLVPREGGEASPLASPPGPEMFPRFSPNGEQIVFSANYDGNRELYVVSTEGGVPRRITHHPATEVPCEWIDDETILFMTNGFAGLQRQTQLYKVSAQGGLPEALPVPYGAFGSIDASGTRLAYVPHSRDNRTWKRYRGGMATDIWVFDLVAHTSLRLTDWEGTDSLPMWHGDDVVYLSDDGDSHRLNLWASPSAGGERRQLTRFGDFDVKWPSMGPGPAGGGEVVFQYGSSLTVLDLADGALRRLEVRIPGARQTLRPRRVDDSEFITRGRVGPTGKRIVVEARGDVWTLPAEKGTPRNLTHSSGAADRDPSWSPDGKWIAYFSDATGEYELWIAPSDGRGEPRRLTDGHSAFLYAPRWTPNSQKIAFNDKGGAMFLHDIESGETVQFDRDPWNERMDDPGLSFSPDSRWIAYARADVGQMMNSIRLYDIENGELHRVTSGFFSDSSPAFDREGEFLVFATGRHFSPHYSDVDSSFVYSNTQVLAAVPLKADQASPFAPESDEEKAGGDDEGDEEEHGAADSSDDDDDGEHAEESDDDTDDGDEDADEDDDDADEDADDDDGPEPVEIDLDGFEQRAFQLPVEPGTFGRIEFADGKRLVFVRTPARGAEGKPSIRLYDVDDDEPEEKTVVEGADDFVLSADGKRIGYTLGGKPQLADLSADAKGKPVVTAGMTVEIDPRSEWRQVFTDAWRIQRDFFYDANMHGVDWAGVKEQYLPMLEDAVTRSDVSYVIREMISELNVGHAYYWGGDSEKEPEESIGLLGVDWELAGDRYRVARILGGAPWDLDARAPLAQPGMEDVSGMVLLRVNGLEVTTATDPFEPFLGLAGRAVRIEFAPAADSPEDDVVELVVEPLGNETALRYRDWVERKRAYVEERSEGKVGYVYVPNTGVDGQNELVRQFFGQTQKQGLIIDERWNGGGQIPTRFIEMLNRPITNYWARRDGIDWPWPYDGHQGPKAMLINGLAGSGGDAFPHYFREAGLGKLIGTRTWGGLVGISGNPALIDGGYTSVPTFGFYERDGTWGIEGHGVDPDIEVIDDPALMWDGGDPQLDAGLREVLGEIARSPYLRPKRPVGPDRSGMGILPEDR